MALENQNPIDAALLGWAERGVAAGDFDTAADALRLMSSQNGNDATENLRATLIAFYGPLRGKEIFDQAVRDRAEAEKITELASEFEEVKTALSRDLEAGKMRHDELQHDVNVAYCNWRSAQNGLEAQRIRNQQIRAELRSARAAFQEAINSLRPTPPPLVTNWGTPEWVKPEQTGPGNGTAAHRDEP
jgi:hypothetical protein